MPTKPSVTPEELRKLAGLAKLHLTPAQAQQYAGQISAILAHVQTLEAADTGDLAPLSHVLELANVARLDEPVPSMERDLALGNAPGRDAADKDKPRASDGEFFLVPAVLKPDP